MNVPRLYRIAVPVDDIEAATTFYAHILGTPGERVWVNRHYFRCGEVILACVAPAEAPTEYRTQIDPRIIYFAVDDIDAAYKLAKKAGCRRIDKKIEKQSWGERSFYFDDPFGNPICFVAGSTRYTGGVLEEE